MSRIRSSSVVSVFCSVVVCLGPTSPLAADEIAGTIAARELAAQPQSPVDAILEAWTKAAEQEAKLDAVLKAWSRASRDCRSYDARLTRWDYDPVFGDSTKPKRIDQGRLLYQRDGASRIELKHEWDAVWRDAELLEIRRERGECRIYGAKSFAAAKAWRNAPKDQGWLADLCLSPIIEPKQAVPYLFLGDTKKLRSDYDLDYEFTPKGSLIIAVAKSTPRRFSFARISILIRAAEALPYAIKLQQPHGGAVVFLMHEPKLDSMPIDAEVFLNPDLSDLKRVDMDADFDQAIGDSTPAMKPR